ncbi:MAG: hypothetical protein QF613_03135 [Candidatus Marinimicrobia bacterium]|jgi:hypothetical protein|nr:hypothetical protein [Candidatus Neomarinimicrobiota bacterium]MDP6593189.1 hypothetical protein [Candidatus Neomarinimicrobiota bacterium]|tara:strand:+ start:7843 stop:8274 length:432 start_codon:yes stop_codon:yes gene_type:complete
MRKTLFILLMITVLGGQDRSESDFWQSLSDSGKVLFLQGLYTGFTESLNILQQEALRQKREDAYWSPPFSHENSAKRLKEYYADEMPAYEVIAAFLDAFYSNPDNLHIEFLDALHIVMLHQNGKIQRANELLLMKQKELLKGR